MRLLSACRQPLTCVHAVHRRPSATLRRQVHKWWGSTPQIATPGIRLRAQLCSKWPPKLPRSTRICACVWCVPARCRRQAPCGSRRLLTRNDLRRCLAVGREPCGGTRCVRVCGEAPCAASLVCRAHRADSCPPSATCAAVHQVKRWVARGVAPGGQGRLCH